MKPNFNEMTVAELRKYVLAHRDDMEAIRALFHHPSLKYQQMPPLVTEDGMPSAENIRIAEEAIKKRAEIAREKQKQREKEIEEKLRQKLEQEIEEKLRPQIELEVEQKLREKLEKEIEARLLPKITGENQQFDRPTTATVTAEEIARFREQLKHDPEALAALDTIQECEGNLEEAARSIATAAGNTDVESDLLEKLSSRCRTVICQEDMKEKLPVLIAAIAGFLASSSGFPSRLATPIALFAIEKGSENFCDL
jgi:membrane-associated HD superfamily phosphohydrolase